MDRGLFTLAALTACLVLTSAGCKDKRAAASGPDPAVLSAQIGAGAQAAADAGPPVEDVTLPRASSPDLDARMRHLLEAIAQNNPDLAADMLFPRDAYIAMRDSTDPQRAWEKKVSGAYGRSIERLHKRLKGAERAKFVSFELGHSVVQITPRKKDWKRPLWRVKHSKLSLSIDGKARTIDIAEMTAWRGAWYVTKLR